MAQSVNWELDTIFPGGSESRPFAAYLEQLMTDFETFAAREPLPPLAQAHFAAWTAAIETLSNLGERLNQAGSFVGCLVSQNVRDEKALQLMGRVDGLRGRLGTHWAELSALFAAQPDTAWESLLQQPALAPIAFSLNEQRDQARRKLPPEQEVLINELAIDGYHAWDRLYGLVSGNKQVEFDGQTLSLGQLQGKFMDDPEREVRQRAFVLFEETWEDLAKVCAAALNYQAGFRLTVYKHRGWKSVIEEPLSNNRLTLPTLEAMWDVVDRKAVKLLDYFAAKARIIGVEKLAWYDTWAPIDSLSRQYTFTDAADFVVENLHQLNPNIAAYCRMAIDRRWVEAEDRPFKRAGAYHTSFPETKESRIFMTFNGSYNGLLTLAHELGHGYHSYVMIDLPYGARRYTMSVAETASTMNELIVKDATIQQAADAQERLSLLSTKLNDAASFMMNIRARYDFERDFFAARAGGPLTVDQLSTLMFEAQQRAYKNGLCQYHPLFWASKLHFYLTRTPFYNFPYTFGFLFSNGVYDQAKGEGRRFQDRYEALLRDTGSMTTEQLASHHLGVDLTKPAFWEAAVDRVLADVDEFVALADEVARP